MLQSINQSFYQYYISIQSFSNLFFTFSLSNTSKYIRKYLDLS